MVNERGRNETYHRRVFLTIVAFSFTVGSLLEAFYSLLGYGIGGIIPVGHDGRIKGTVIEQWIQRQLTAGSSRTVVEVVCVPKVEDVLLGRGKKVQSFPGNMKFRQKIEENRYLYDNATKFEKSVLIETILRSVKDVGGRFLQHGTCGYVEVDDDVARKKISHAWRNLRASGNRTISLPSPLPLPPRRHMDSSSLMPNILDDSTGYFFARGRNSS